jgi:glucose-6-phosphate isomerase
MTLETNEAYRKALNKMLLSKSITVEEVVENIDSLRQWLNEDRIQDPKHYVTNDDIARWLINGWK